MESTKEDYAVLHCAVIYFRLGLWRHHFKVNNSIKLLSSGKIQTWFICTLAIWIPSSTLQYLLCNFYGWIWSSAISFLPVLWWRGVSICYRLTGEFWIKSTGWDFYHCTGYWKSLKESSVFFSWASKEKRFIMELFFEEFNLIFFTTENAWPVLKFNQGSDVLENFEVHFLLYQFMVKETTLLRGSLCIYKMFHRRLIHFG